MARTRHLKITVEGKVYDVVVEDLSDDESNFYPSPGLTAQAARPAPAAAPAAASAAPASAPSAPAAGTNDKVAPMGGTVIEVTVQEGDSVGAGDQVLILEAMKMKQTVTAHKDGKVSKIHVQAGQAVDAGQALLTIE